MESITPPPAKNLIRETLGLLELPRLAIASPALARQQRGDGRSVLVFPGYGASDGSTGVLRRYLRYLGYDARGWGLGRNDGQVPRLIPEVTKLVRNGAHAAGEAVSLIGWSLGGYLAREAARNAPDAVDRVITLGSPIVGGPKYTVTAHHYVRQGYDLDEIEAQVAARDLIPLTVPVTAIYSRRDSVVAWQACVDHRPNGVENIEVGTTHLGLGFSPEVFRILAERLARCG